MKPVRTFIGSTTFSIILLLIKFLLPLKTEAAIGKGLEFVEGQPLNIRAESLEYFPEENLFVAEGSVEITYRKSRLTADRVEFNEITSNALAIGNVVYEEEGETMMADRAELNFDSEKGIVYIGEIALANDHYITGQEIEKTGKDTYLFRKGSYTACSGPWPAWKFRSSQAKIHQGEYLQAWNTVGYVKGIPVFYFPYFVFPIKTDRQTGFLVPDIGRSTTKGFTISNAFFWAISSSQDATVRHTFYEERGHKIDLEYRYKYSKETDGTFESQFIRDKLDLTEKAWLTWTHRQGLPYGIKGLMNLNLTSNKQFNQDFGTTLDERTNQRLASDVSFTKNFSQHTIRLFVDRVEDLREASNRVDQRLPELHIISQQQQLLGSPLYIAQTTQIAHLKRAGTDKKEFDRVDLQPTLSLPLNLIGQALTINPSLQLRETYYTRDATTASNPDLEAKSTHREYYAASVGINGPKLNRIFDFGTTGRTQKLKHLIEPNLSFYYAPGIDETNLPKFDGIDRIGSEQRSRSMSYGITQRLLVKQVTENEWQKFLKEKEEQEASPDKLPTETKELASLSVSQSYNFEADQYYKFSNITVTLQTMPFENYNFKLGATYDVYVKTFVGTNIDLGGQLWNFLNFGMTWRRNSTVKRETNDILAVNQFLDLTTQMNLFGRVGISYRGRFNIEDHERMEDNIGFTYNAQCWNIVGNYTQQLVGGNRDKGFSIMLELKHLGRLFNITG